MAQPAHIKPPTKVIHVIPERDRELLHLLGEMILENVLKDEKRIRLRPNKHNGSE